MAEAKSKQRGRTATFPHTPCRRPSSSSRRAERWRKPPHKKIASRSDTIIIQDFPGKKSELYGIMTTFPNLAAKCPRPPPRRGRGLPFQPENSTALIHEKHSANEVAECCAHKTIAHFSIAYTMRLQIVGVVHFLFLAQFYPYL